MRFKFHARQNRRFGFVVNVGARQVRRNRRPFGLAFLRVRGWRAELLDFLLDCGDIRRTRFIEQLDLVG